MVKSRSTLLQNCFSTGWNIFFCNKIICFSYICKKISKVRVFFKEDIKIFMQTLFRHFDSPLIFKYYLHNHFRFSFQLFSWIIFSVEHKNFNCLWQNKGNHRSSLSKIQKICFKIWARRGFQLKNFTKSMSKFSSLSQ